MFQEAFYKVERPESDRVLEDANPHFAEARFDPAAASLLAYDLPFYQGYRLIEVSQHGGTQALRRHFIHAPGQAIALNWTSDPVYKLNQDLPIKLTLENVPVYIRFFFGYVRGRHGRFRIAESVSDIPWREDPPASARKAVGRMIQPIQLISREALPPFSLFVCMVHGDALYRTTVTVQANGMVQIGEEERLVDDMPVRDDIFGL